MVLKPEELRELTLIGQGLARTDPTLARALSEPLSESLSPPRPPGPANPGAPLRAPLLRWQVLAFLVLMGWSALGLAPLVLGLRWHEAWMLGIGAVTVVVLPIAGSWATFRVFPRWRDRLRSTG